MEKQSKEGGTYATDAYLLAHIAFGYGPRLSSNSISHVTLRGFSLWDVRTLTEFLLSTERY